MAFSSQNSFDAVVLGGGPAGAVTALCLARRGARVCLFEGDPGDRYGETLPPEINPVLRDLGLWDEFLQLGAVESPGIVTAWGGGEPYAQDFLENAHGCGWHVDRTAFDSMLCRAAADAGVDCRPGRGNPAELAAALVIDATGRSAAGAREVDDRLLAIVLRGESRGADCRAYIETAPDGWWYSAPLPDRRVVAMFFTDPDFYQDEGIVLGEQLIAAPLTRTRLDTAEIHSTRTVGVSSSCRREIAGEGRLVVGDSASSYDPLSGRGVFKALRHAQQAAAIPALEYAALVRSEYETYVRQRRSYYSLERRWAERPFWKKRHVADVG